MGKGIDFYIQDTRGYVGNSVLWWGVNGGGYTTDIERAGKYTEDEAQKICKNRDTDRAFPCKYIDSIVSKHVDMQRVDRKKRMAIHRRRKEGVLRSTRSHHE